MENPQNNNTPKVRFANGKVYRPRGFWSEAVHRLLKHLEKEKFDAAPKSFGFDSLGNEILSFVPGKAYNYPLTEEIASEQTLVSAADLLRKYHEATRSFIAENCHNNLKWLLSPKEPYEVICHGDFAPYNVTLKGERTIGIFDFDTAHPAPAIWDVAYAVYCWAPFKTNTEDALGDLPSQINRAKSFCDSYGLPENERKALAETMITRLQTLIDFMQAEAEKGNAAFISNLKDGHHLSYLEDIEYLRKNEQTITKGLLT